MKKNINKIAICSLIVVVVIFVYMYANTDSEDLISLFNGYYEIDVSFKQLSESDSNSIIIKQDSIEFIPEGSDNIIISLDYRKISKRGLVVTALAHSSGSDNEENPFIDIDLTIILDLKTGILTLKNENAIMGVYVKDNMITSMM